MPYVGGAAYAHTLLAPLETLSSVEETVVREKAVEALAKVGAELPEDSVAEHFTPLIKARALRVPALREPMQTCSSQQLPRCLRRRAVSCACKAGSWK